MAKITIPPFEQGVTRVFSLSLNDREARQLRDTSMMQEAALGVETLVPTGVEIFALNDLGDMGLAGYLRDGVDIKEADLSRDRAKLAALEGWVMILHSSAFDNAQVILDPARAMTLIGTYGQTPAAQATDALESEAAAPYSGSPAHSRGTPPFRTRKSGSLTTAVFVLLVLATLWWILF